MRIKNLSKLFFLALIGLFIGCTSEPVDEESNKEEALEVEMEAEIPNEKTLTINKDGLEEEVEAEIYVSDKDAPMEFFTYLPEGFEANITNDPEDSYSINFAKDGGSLILTFLTKNLEEEAAKDAARMRIKEAGEVKENGMEFNLSDNSEQIITTVLEQQNGQYYYWTKQYPADKATEFEPYAMMIMRNMEWTEKDG